MSFCLFTLSLIEKMKGKFVIVTGPSASGKTRLVDFLVWQVPDSAKLVTVTTRLPRPGEKDGVDYFFTDRPIFEKRMAEGEFFEYAEVYGNLYGSSRKVLESFRERFSFVFAVIDVQGARTLKNAVTEAFAIFLRPENFADITRRLKVERRDMTEREFQERVLAAEKELSLAESFDAVIMNKEGDFESTGKQALDLIKNFQRS